MSAVEIEMEGFDRVEKMLQDYPKGMTDLIKRAIRRAAKPEMQRANSAKPYEWSSMKAKAVVKSKKDNILFSGGFFGQKSNRDGTIPDWFKAYWYNYGTLEGRDPQHEFKNGVKSGSKRRRNNIGQKHENFFEIAMQGAEERIARETLDTVRKSVAEFENKINNGK